MANKVMYVAKMVHNETLDDVRTVLVFAATRQEACHKAEEFNSLGYYHLVSCEKLEYSFDDLDDVLLCGEMLARPFLRPAYVDE